MNNKIILILSFLCSLLLSCKGGPSSSAVAGEDEGYTVKVGEKPQPRPSAHPISGDARIIYNSFCGDSNYHTPKRKERLLALKNIPEKEWRARVAALGGVKFFRNETVKYLKKAIEEKAPPDLREELIQIVESVKVMDDMELSTTKLGSTTYEKWASVYVKNKCNSAAGNGLADSVFQDTDGDNLTGFPPGYKGSGFRYAVVCSGRALSGPSSGTDADEAFANILFALSHEFGHFLAKYSLNSGFKECLEDKLSHYLLPIVIRNKDQSTSLDPKITVKMHFVEIAADMWAIETLYQYAKAKGLEGPKLLQTARSAWGSFCGAPDNGEHPSGEFRVGVLGGGHAQLIHLFDAQMPAVESCNQKFP